MKNIIQAVFIDRDGTIGGDGEVIYPGEFTLYPFTKNAFKLLKKENIKIFAFTNQPGISLGNSTEDRFVKELLDFGLEDAYICPHTPEQCCMCRKPEAGLLLKAAVKHGLDLSRCAVIGDRLTDMLAADKVHARKILVMTGVGKESVREYQDKLLKIELDYIAANLLGAVEWILE
ncbi:Hypothetical protein LUCI_0829 [Lucifera butyrica]|uniref:D,D-heptose 1,7-bisphosphate phosphatase n=1 Tax=Lucifera butyrica TaxID=1351585 RepID=A0A498R370_9FIRM|nr:HAD-IIIA family hydrolase [Lucifera butyrica]VBB05619.1 Hypothetical protein LUCI_0829 [Lucifera butyrica]